MDGIVVIAHTSDMQTPWEKSGIVGTDYETNIDARVHLDAGSWASIVAHVSAEGGNGFTFRLAQVLHGEIYPVPQPPYEVTKVPA
jgi:hypothetical protein